MSTIITLIIVTMINIIWYRMFAESERSRKDFPIGSLLNVLWYISAALFFHDGDTLYQIFSVAVAAVWASIIYDWWRRRRQGKPSKVLGIVRDIGHKLTVVNIPKAETNG